MLFTSHGRRLKPIRHETVPRPCEAHCQPVSFLAPLPWGYPQGHDQINSHGHYRRDGNTAGDDVDLSQPEDCFPI